MKFITALASAVILAAATSLCAQEKPDAAPAAEAKAAPEAAAVAEGIAAYAAVYNKGDAKALATLFAEDAEWVDGEGKVTAGRAAIGELFSGVFAGSKGRTLEVSADSVRKLTAEVLSANGTSVVTDSDGENDVSSFTAVYVQNGGKWLISQYTETGAPFANSAGSHLQDLGELVGSWKVEAEGTTIRNTLEWAAGGNFLNRTFSVITPDGENDREGTEVIGWDAGENRIRSWVFESDGSFSERFWTQDGNRFLIKSRTTLPDGGMGSEELNLTIVDKDTATWSTASRIVDGEALPNIPAVTSVREK